MPIGYSAQQNFRKIPVLGLVMESGASAPTTPTNGQLWYDTGNNKGKLYENGSWVDIFSAAAAGGPAGGDLSGTYPNPQIASGSIVLGDLSSALLTTLDGYRPDVSKADVMTRLDAFQINFTGAGVTTANRPDISGVDVNITGAPTGSAGGDLTGTYPNPQIASGVIVIGDINTSSVRLDNIGIPTANVNMNGRYIQNLLDPVGSSDAATKNYVDAAAQGLDAKASVRLASTANVNLASVGTIDGVATASGDRILLKNQTTAAENGIYVLSGSIANRAPDMDAWAEVPSAYVWVEQGTSNADTGWLCTNDQGGTLGSTAITWVQFSGAGQVVAGAGMTKTGNTLDVVAGDTSLTVAADSVVVNTGVIAALASPTFTGDPKAPTPTAGDNDTSIATTAFVTGAISTAVAGTGTVKKYAQDVGALTAGVALTITHSLNTLDVDVQVYTKSDGSSEQFAIARTGVNTITITSDIAYAANLYRVVVVG